MDLRSIANSVSVVVNDNTLVTIQPSTGYTIGAGLKQVPNYGNPVMGYAQVQELTNSELKQIDGLNITTIVKSIYLRGPLRDVIRPDSKGGDIVIIGNETWLTVKTFEAWPLWVKCAICRQENPS